MNFTRRTNFKDQIDQEIYIWKMLLELSKLLYKSDINGEFSFKKGHIVITSSGHISDSYTLHHRVRFVGGGSYDVIEIGSDQYLNIMNMYLPDRVSINRNPSSDYCNAYTIVNGDGLYDDSDDRLDALLDGGVNKITEELYFQESLVRNDYLYDFNDIERLLETITVEFDLPVAVFHARVPNWDHTVYEELIDIVLEMLNAPS